MRTHSKYEEVLITYENPITVKCDAFIKKVVRATTNND